MKNFITKFAAFIVIAAMFIALIPSVCRRFQNEANNNSIVVSLLYNDLRNKVAKASLGDSLDEFKKAGVNTVSVMEEDINSLVATGSLTCIKYNVLLHKYDDESMHIGEVIRKYPQVAYDSYIVMTKREETKKLLEKWIPQKYKSDQFVKIEGVQGMDIYAFLDGTQDMWEIVMGYKEEDIKALKDKGFDIGLIFKIKNYENTGYLDYIDYLVKKYDIKYLNIKDDFRHPEKEKEAKAHYEGIEKIIRDNKMTLVVTENTNQLSNQKPIGYFSVFNSVFDKKKPSSNSVMRSFETYDNSNSGTDETKFLYRYNQLLNSTIDRNMRFITVTQQIINKKSYVQSKNLTVRSTKAYIDEIKRLGYDVNGQAPVFDNYTAHNRVDGAAAAVIMIMFALLMIEMITGKRYYGLTVVALILSALTAGATVLMPVALLSLYSSLCSVIIPCFGMTVLFWILKQAKDKMNVASLTFVCALGLIITLSLSGLVMISLLSGVSYYVNNDIFRGIKLALFTPILYTAVLYYFMFARKSSSISEDLRKALNAKIKVYWILIAGFFGVIGFIYILRSGNVSSISSVELIMRNTITNIFSARPRTKEFFVGYPCLVLFVYYFKKSDSKLLQWLFATGSSILAASTINSFCHVFTDASTIYMRIVNSMIVASIVCVFVAVANLVVVRIVRYIKAKSLQGEEKVGRD
ncbi:MAG: DUF5693 family protein [Bacillota bacterium]|nr:DUF5693 family protein [Bacillota bacterium]